MKPFSNNDLRAGAARRKPDWLSSAIWWVIVLASPTFWGLIALWWFS